MTPDHDAVKSNVIFLSGPCPPIDRTSDGSSYRYNSCTRVPPALNRRHSCLPIVVCAFFLCTAIQNARAQEPIVLASPSSSVTVRVDLSDSIYYDVGLNDHSVLTRATLALLTNHGAMGIRPRIQKIRRRAVRTTIINPVPFKRKEIPDHFNEMTLQFRGGYSVVFRAYDDGVAYRFITTVPDSLRVENEIANFAFAAADTVYFPQVQKRNEVDIFHTSFEEPYQVKNLSAVSSGDLCFLQRSSAPAA